MQGDRCELQCLKQGRQSFNCCDAIGEDNGLSANVLCQQCIQIEILLHRCALHDGFGELRCHLLVTSSKWEDHGNCNLQITRPPPGMRQELRIRHGMEKRVIVTKIPKKSFGFGSSSPEKDKPLIVLDVVLGSKCFSRLGSRGIILNVWEERTIP